MRCSACPLSTLWDVGNHCGTVKMSHNPCCVVGNPFGSKWIHANFLQNTVPKHFGMFWFALLNGASIDCNHKLETSWCCLLACR